MSTEAEFDTRVVERNIKSGTISKEDYEKYVETLEDCADQAIETETQMVFKSAEEGDEPADDAADIQEDD